MTEVGTEIPEVAPVPTWKVAGVFPWGRYCAKNVDLFAFALLISVVSLVLGFHLRTPYSRFILDVEIIVAFPIFEAAQICLFRSTAGKLLFRIRVDRPDGDRLTMPQAIGRSYRCLAWGLGLCIPIVTLFTLLRSYDRLKKEGRTEWDAVSLVAYRSQRPAWWSWLILASPLIITTGFVIYAAGASRQPTYQTSSTATTDTATTTAPDTTTTTTTANMLDAPSTYTNTNSYISPPTTSTFNSSPPQQPPSGSTVDSTTISTPAVPFQNPNRVAVSTAWDAAVQEYRNGGLSALSHYGLSCSGHLKPGMYKSLDHCLAFHAYALALAKSANAPLTQGYFSPDDTYDLAAARLVLEDQGDAAARLVDVRNLARLVVSEVHTPPPPPPPSDDGVNELLSNTAR